MGEMGRVPDSPVTNNSITLKLIPNSDGKNELSYLSRSHEPRAGFPVFFNYWKKMKKHGNKGEMGRVPDSPSEKGRMYMCEAYHVRENFHC